jgi:hypothetical protein
MRIHHDCPPLSRSQTFNGIFHNADEGMDVLCHGIGSEPFHRDVRQFQLPQRGALFGTARGWLCRRRRSTRDDKDE